MADQPATASTTHASRLVYPPIVHVIWGAILIVIFLLWCLIQMQTNEAWFLHSEDPSAWIPRLNFFMQFPQFWNGDLGARQSVAFLGSVCIQVIMLTTKIGMARVQLEMVKRYGGGSLSHEEIVRAARRRGWFWDVLSNLIILGNSITDFIYAGPLGFIQQVVFAVVIFLTSFYAGSHGLQHLTIGISDMKRK